MICPEPSFCVDVDVTNPGQFFACCGLLELAHRLHPGAEGWFAINQFNIAVSRTSDQLLPKLLGQFHDSAFVCDGIETDHKTCPLRLTTPFNLRLDWWLDGSGGDALKTWAGQQSVSRIALATKQALPASDDLISMFDYGSLVRDVSDHKKVVEPFYFDARRFSHALDAGFSLDVQETEALAYPAVEALSLIGLQRFRPATTEDKWAFEYSVWLSPLPASVAAAVCCTVLAGQRYRFKLLFRDDQKRYKAFSFAIPIGGQT